MAMIALRPENLSARLIALGIATPQQLEQAKQELAMTQERFSAILARQGLLRDVEAGRRLATQFGSVPQRLDARPETIAAAAQVPGAMWRAHRLIPLREQGGTLVLATDDPLSVFALEFFSGRCGRPLEAVLVREQDFAPLLEVAPTVPPLPAMSQPASAPVVAPAVPPKRAEPSKPQPAARPPGPAASDGTDAPIIQLVNSMLSEAVRMRASDVHLQVGLQQLRVRYRIDGVLRDATSPPKALHGPIVSRIKIMAGLNIAEKRLPQDGRLQVTVDTRPLDVRVSVLPAMHGESVVMRLLDRSQPIRGMAEMGMASEDQRLWDALIRRPHGIVLVTGPTGSGKTTTLYGALSLLNHPDRKLITVEDPVEYQLPGVNQVQVKASIGLTFAAGLRSMLRQAPDIIMVGEIRDQETAQIAIQAALTGHLVLSTLHTNDAPSAVTRLIDMGVAPFLVASTIQGILAQRLVRRICPHCRMTDNATEEERAFLGAPDVIQLIRSNGCDKCNGSGFLGRVGLFELLVIDEAVRQLVIGKPTASAIRSVAVNAGMRGLREDGCLKIRDGLTTMAEVLRVVAGTEA
ncbi:MAG: type II secretion system protein GspE [Candidatus Omnitrophica bacterium CG11_big_fil_rev_8_21_14_0_20_63_9]|nr:MAG: type II secretion system protein GspE [Candidatus Omnitrophica bacterium CG11_big_fil_rev_8_21_14_0_20_63_9]